MLRDDSIKDYVNLDDQLKYFRCAFSGKLPAIAVKIAGLDQVFDLEELRTWKTQHPGAIFPHSGKRLRLQDLDFDFTHMQSMMDRLENLRQKTIRYLEPTIYYQTQFLNRHLGNGGVVPVVLSYIGIEERVREDALGNYQVTGLVNSHPILQNLFDLTLGYTQWLDVKKHELRLAYKAELRSEIAKNSEEPSKAMTDICKAWEGLKKRKVLWCAGIDRPVINNGQLPFSTKTLILIAIPVILTFPISIPLLSAIGTAEKEFYYLNVVNLKGKIDDRVVEYRTIRS